MIGTGIFSTTGFQAGDLGDGRLILAVWFIGALFAICGALSYSELGVNFPSSGGEYVYLTQAFGPAWGFMSGWVSFFAGFSAPIAAAALAFSDYSGRYSHGVKQAVAIGLIATLTIVNLFGVKRVAAIQNVLTGTKLIVIATFVFAGFVWGHGDWGHLTTTAARTSTLALPGAFAISLLWVMVGYSGWNASTYVGEELKHPARTLPLSLGIGTAIVTVAYIGLNLLFIYATPLDQMRNVVAVGALAATNLFGPGIGKIFAGLMAVSLVSTVNAMITIGPRVYYAMAHNGAFLKAAATVHPKWHTPVVAILCQGLCAIAMTITPFPELIVYIGFSLTFFTVMAVASLFVFRQRPNWQRLKAVDFLFPLIPGAYILVGLSMIAYGIVWRPVPSLTALATIILGAAVYRVRAR